MNRFILPVRQSEAGCSPVDRPQLITIPPLIMFMIFNRKIVAGMTAGAVKG
jgi:hypothetical protein